MPASTASSRTCSPASTTARRVVAFNTSEGWAHDVSEDIAREVAKRHQERGTGSSVAYAAS